MPEQAEFVLNRFICIFEQQKACLVFKVPKFNKINTKTAQFPQSRENVSQKRETLCLPSG
jgi:hypothetical protein